MTAGAGATRASDAPILAVVANPIWPIKNGYSLRASRLIRELAARRRRVILAGPVGDASMSDLERTLGVARVVALPQFRGWDSPLTDADRAAIRQTIDGILNSEQPGAAVVWPAADAAMDHPRFPPRVLDRMDSEVVMAWRELRHQRGTTNKIRAVRNLLLWIPMERRMIRSAFATIVDAPTDQRVMRRVGGTGSVYIAASGVDVQPLSPPADESSTPTVVFTGSMSYAANIDAARWFTSAVWPSVRARVPNARFVIAGRRPAPEVAALASLPGVEVHADVPDMWAVLRESWLAIAPVRTGSGIRTKVLEAWAVGRPVVLNAVGATGLQLDDDARSLIAETADATATLVVRLLTDARERHRIGQSAHALVTRAHAGWSSAGETLSRLLDDAAASRYRTLITVTE